MTEQEERMYSRGSRAAWFNMFLTCLNNLGYNDPITEGAAFLVERAATITTLRRLCSEYGDNDWPDDLHLSDIIEKHLIRHLEK